MNCTILPKSHKPIIVQVYHPLSSAQHQWGGGIKPGKIKPSPSEQRPIFKHNGNKLMKSSRLETAMKTDRTAYKYPDCPVRRFIIAEQKEVDELDWLFQLCVWSVGWKDHKVMTSADSGSVFRQAKEKGPLQKEAKHETHGTQAS